MKFTTYVPISDNHGVPYDEDFLERVIEQPWRPFKGMSEEGPVRGRWINDAEIIFRDINKKISIECGRERLQEAIRAVRKHGRRLKQEKMYFEVDGYDGVQFLILK